MFPLLPGSDDDRSTLQALFERAAYDESRICARLSIPGLEHLGPGVTVPSASEPLCPTTDALLRLFAVVDGLTTAEWQQAFSTRERTALEATDLVRVDRGLDRYTGSVQLLPIAVDGTRFMIACDPIPAAGMAAAAPDVVFSAHNPLTTQFLRLVPPADRCERVLDVGCGTGIGAIALGGRGVGVDIAPRSVHFARFNAWLNALPLDVRVSDLYDAVAGQHFDCVLAHPPYVPTLTPRALYRDGGETGEAIVRRVIEGLPSCLAVGGLFLMPCIAMDLEQGRFEDRVRQWLAAAAPDFDLVYAVVESKPPEAFARDLARRVSNAMPDEEQQWLVRFAQWQVRQALFGVLVMRRHGRSRAPHSRRVRLGDQTRFSSFAWLLEQVERSSSDDHVTRTAGLCPRLADEVSMHVRYGVQDGRFATTGVSVENAGWPFPSTLVADEGMARLLMACDAATTVETLYRDLGGAEAGLSMADMVNRIDLLVERGVLTLE